MKGDWGIAVGMANEVDWEVATVVVLVVVEEEEEGVEVGVGRIVTVGRGIETMGRVGRGIAALTTGLIVNLGFRNAEKGTLILCSTTIALL